MANNADNYTWPSEYKDLYDNYWWKSLWKIIWSDLSKKIAHLSVPVSVCVRVSEVLNWNSAHTNDQLLWLYDKDVVLKLSKIDDDFSWNASRWKNSSLWLPKFKGWPNLMNEVAQALTTLKISQDVKSIILDERIKLPNEYLFLLHFDGNTLKMEVSKNDRERMFYKIDSDWNILDFERNSDNIDHNEMPVDTIPTLLEIHKSIYAELGNLSINTEWFYESWKFHMIQVRPIPKDETRLHDFDEIDGGLKTNFVYGIFDEKWIPEQIDSNNYLSSETKIFILDRETRWFSPLLRERLAKWLRTILIDTYDWFHISHDPQLLPEYWTLRLNFNYISYHWEEDLIWKNVQLISNGTKWIFILNNDPMWNDKFEARNLKKKCNFRYLESTFSYPPERVTSVGVIPFTDDGKIVVIELKRWFDIPWGHVQKWEENFHMTVEREAMEEAFIKLKDIELTTVVESDYFWSEPEQLTYMLFHVAKVEEILDFIPNQESFSRTTMNKEEFIDTFQWDKELITQVVMWAYKRLFSL